MNVEAVKDEEKENLIHTTKVNLQDIDESSEAQSTSDDQHLARQEGNCEHIYGIY